MTVTDLTTSNTLNNTTWTGTSNKVKITSDNSNTTCYVPFSKTIANDSSSLYIDDTSDPKLTYNPSTGILSTNSITVSDGTTTSTLTPSLWNSSSAFTYNLKSSVVGAVPYQVDIDNTGFLAPGTLGQVLTCNGAGLAPSWGTGGGGSTGTINITDTPTSGTYYPTFVDSAGTSKILRADVSTTPMTYNPLTGTLTTLNINAKPNFTQDEIDAVRYIAFTAGSGNREISVNTNSLLCVNPSNSTIYASNFDGLASNSTNAVNVGITTDNTSGTYYLPFVKTSASGYKQLYIDDTTGPLNYNPSTGTLTTTNFNGLASTSTTLNVTNTNTNATHYLTFIDNNTTGQKSFQADASLQYNPSTNLLTTNNLTVTSTGNVRSGNGAYAEPNFGISDSVSNNSISFVPNAPPGAWNPATSTNDSIILGKNIDSELQSLQLSIWSTTYCAVKLKPSFLSLGYGGITGVPSSSIILDGSNIIISPNLKFPDNSIQSNAYTGAGTLAGSYTNTNLTIDANGKITALANGTGGSTNASTINVTETNNNTPYYVTFTDSIGLTKSLFGNSLSNALTYNPSTSTLTCTNFSGNANSAGFSTFASNITTTFTTNNTQFYPLMTAFNTTGNRPAASCTGISFNPSTNAVTATSFLGNATTATTSNNIAGGLGGQIPYQTAANTTALLANGTAGQVLQSNGTTLAPSWTTPATTITNTNTAGTYYPIFASGTGAQALLADTTTGPMTYNPSTGAFGINSVSFGYTSPYVPLAGQLGQTITSNQVTITSIASSPIGQAAPGDTSTSIVLPIGVWSCTANVWVRTGTGVQSTVSAMVLGITKVSNGFNYPNNPAGLSPLLVSTASPFTAPPSTAAPGTVGLVQLSVNGTVYAAVGNTTLFAGVSVNHNGNTTTQTLNAYVTIYATRIA